jgi:hypothetical protein
MTTVTVLRDALHAMLARSIPEGEDYKGFNAADENAARTFTRLDVWTKDQFMAVRKLLWKYRRQLRALGFYYDRASHRWAKEAADAVTVRAAILGRTEKALKVWLPTQRGTLWVPTAMTRFASEGFKPGRSGAEFEVGMLTLPAWKAAQAQPYAG